jgi:hypothetical protein
MAFEKTLTWNDSYGRVEGLEEEEKEARIKSLLKGLDKQFMEYVKKTESPRFTKASFSR